MTDLSELLKRVKAAPGRIIALEREIMCALGGWQRLPPSQHPRNHKHPMFVDTHEGYLSHEGRTLYRDVPRIMDSVDAALAFAERVLPVNSTRLHSDPSGCSAHITWWPEGLSGDKRCQGVGEAELLPLAIIAATLTALISQEPDHDHQ